MAGSTVFLKPTECQEEINRPRARGRPRKEPLQVVRDTVLDGAAPAEADEEKEGEVIEMVDTTDEVPTATGPASSSAAAPAPAMQMEVQKLPGRASPESEPATKKSRRSAVAAIVDQVLNEYKQPDPEDHELVYGEGGIVLERSAESLREGRMVEGLTTR